MLEPPAPLQPPWEPDMVHTLHRQQQNPCNGCRCETAHVITAQDPARTMTHECHPVRHVIQQDPNGICCPKHMDCYDWTEAKAAPMKLTLRRMLRSASASTFSRTPSSSSRNP